MSDLWQKAEEAKAFIIEQCKCTPRVAIIAGSGLSPLSGMVQNPVVIPYSELPHFPQSLVEHHPAKLIIGTIEGVSVLLFNGRYHSYEGHRAADVAFMVYVAKLCGVTTLITTNSAGALASAGSVRSLMLITDQINSTGQTPLMGVNDYRFGPRYPSMHAAYSVALQELAQKAAEQCNIELGSGVYAGIIGPQTETPAEAKVLRNAGADIVGMSTVLETIAAVQCGLEVLGFSVITDSVALSGNSEAITPKAAKKAAQITVNSLIQLIKKVLKNYV